MAVTLLAAVWMIVTMIRIVEFLRRRGRKINLLWLRVMIFQYVSEYRRITMQELGRPGTLYYQMSTSGLLMLAGAVFLFLALRAR